MNKRIDWIRYALDLAKVAATRSEDPHVKVGATILRKDHSVASLGYNGVPSGINIKWADRNERRKRVIHAEINALLKLDYNNPKRKLMYVTLSPCRMCAKAMINAGINEVIYDEEYRDTSSLDILRDASIICRKM